MNIEELKNYIRDVPDFPKPGIIFKDITPLLADGRALATAVDRIAEPFLGAVDLVLGIESRGFIVGAPVAYRLGVGLAIARKPGKLPTFGWRSNINWSTAPIPWRSIRTPSARTAAF